ncbi:MAG: hypothetical protein K9G44_02700 [Melioribacteraceae bacterium]|nr:hypothetical protein [Melioribacteraceae bacterium]
MKNLSSFLKCYIVISLISVTIISGKIWYVDQNTANNPDFTTLQAAHDGAASGDTIYVAGFNNSYGYLTLTKKLFIFGPGYFLYENSDTQVRPAEAIVGHITFQTGSEGSLITGLSVYSSGYIRISVDKVIIKRNKVISDYGSPLITVTDNSSNVSIVQNYVVGSRNAAISIGNYCYNIIVANNYLEGGEYNRTALTCTENSSMDLQNNIFLRSVKIYNSIFYNNIQKDGSFSGSSNDIKNNIGNSTQFGTDNGNQSNIDMSTVFTDTGSTDGKWQLKENSPAKGAGFSGEDCGIFGGNNPYVLSGLPAIPAIYYIDAPTTGTDKQGLPVTIKIKAHN